MRLGRIILPAAIVVGACGCATKTYVDERIDERVTRVEARLDEQDARLDELTETSRQALARAEDAGVLARGKFLYTVVFTDDEVTFDTDQSTLSEAAKSRLSGLSGDLKDDNRNVYLEIQGHTDSTGPSEYNDGLGLRRAEAVRRYLHSQGVALDRMATISYGEDAPVADNGTREGRARNRRVEIVVLE